LKRCGTKHTLTSIPKGDSAESPVQIIPFIAGVSAIAIFLFAYYSITWNSFIDAFDVCVQPFCDFVDYYYPMGEAIFHTKLPVEGFLYSPSVALLLSVFPTLGLNVSLILWGILQVLSLIICLLLFRRLVPAGLPIQLFFVALMLSSFPLLLNYIAGQVSIFILAAIFGMLFFYERGNRVIAAALLAFAVSFKFFPLIFLVAFAARRDTRFLMFTFIVCCVFLFILPSVLLGVNDSLRFYGVLFESFRESDWVVTNPHSQFFPHLILRLVNVTGHYIHTYFPLLHWITYIVAAANIGLLFLVQRSRLQYANLWSLQILFLTTPFFLKTSWPHDFFFLPFTQAFLAWQLLRGEELYGGVHTGGEISYSNTGQERISSRQRTIMFFLLLLSIVASNVVFFNLFDNFFGYGFVGFLFWANLLLLIATYVELLPHTLRKLAYRRQLSNTKKEKSSKRW
jgi:hypothetical protein